MARRALGLSISLAGVAAVTFLGAQVFQFNATTVGFAYLLLVLTAATFWGFTEAAAASVAATLTFNYFFLPPIGTFTISNPQNWVALFSFLTTALVASRLSAEAKRRALDAVARQRDLERLYTFSRAILLIDATEPFPKQLVRKLADSFDLSSVILYERRTEEFYRAGPADAEGLEHQLRDVALHGTSFDDAQNQRVIAAVRLGSEPIAALALQGAPMADAVLQGIANLVAIGLERARAQDLSLQIEAVRQNERLRTTILDAMEHELKTPLTSVMAATSALLDSPDQPLESRSELIRIADEEAKRLKQVIDDSLDNARLDSADHITVRPELSRVDDIVREVVASLRNEIEQRPVEIVCEEYALPVVADRRLIKLALKQLVDNALKYSPPESPVHIRVQNGAGSITVAVTDHGSGIPLHEQSRIFERLYRSPSLEHHMPGYGLGLSIAQNVIRAHHGELTVSSRPGQTTFLVTLPLPQKGAEK